MLSRNKRKKIPMVCTSGIKDNIYFMIISTDPQSLYIVYFLKVDLFSIYTCLCATTHRVLRLYINKWDSYKVLIYFNN